MPGAITELQRTQVGKQTVLTTTTPGSNVPATVIMRGKADTMKDSAKWNHVDEQADILGGTTDGYFDPGPSLLPIPASKASPWLMAYIIAYGYQGSTSGVVIAGTTPSGQAYTANRPVNAVMPMTNFATVEFGNDGEAEYIADAVINKWEWNAPYKTMSTLTYGWTGTRPERMGGAAGSGLFTALSTVQPVSYIPSSNCKMFLDPLSSTVWGVTQVNKLMSFKISGDITQEPEFDCGGLQDAYGVTRPVLNYTGDKLKVEFVLRHANGAGFASGATNGIKNLYRKNVLQNVRFFGPGKTLTTPGTLFTQECIQIDGALVITDYDKLASTNKLDTVKFMGEILYNVTSATAGKLTAVLDGVTVLP